MIYSRVSIVIPVSNNAGLLPRLVESIDQALKSHELLYEIIFVDDHSTDDTKQTIFKLAVKYPISGLYLKEGKIGKNHSVLEGLSHASYSLIAVLDPEQKKSAELIQLMVDKLNEDRADVVALDLDLSGVDTYRKIKGWLFRFFLYRLHGVNLNIQSGLLVFKKEIVERITLTPHNFDLQILIKANNAGYKLETIEIYHGAVNVLYRWVSPAWTAVKMKLSRSIVVPFGKKLTKKKGYGFHVRGQEFVNYSNLDLDETALFRLSGKQIFAFFIFLEAMGVALYWNWFATVQVFVALLTFFYFTDLLFNMFLILRSFVAPAEIKISDEQIKSFEDRDFDWPTYSIFCPLYKEAEVLPQFVQAMNKLDYPKDKLQIMLLLEEDDTHTIETARSMNLPTWFEIVVVPDSQPKTKPKACNYGLSKARGQFIVIYDAEDVPDPQQMKKAIIAFEQLGPKTICVQAKLNFYNPKQNILTRVFTAEYSLWFDLVLTGLQSIHGPIPLGGTSNHFRAEHLQFVQGWDAFNVTEDCDLGIRLVKDGYHTAIVDSTTLEEANSNFFNWYRQRSRWIKGYIQTYLVHMRDPRALFKNWREPHILTFQLVVGGKVMSLFINPLMWIITIVYFWQRAVVAPYVEPFFPPLVYYLAVLSLIFGNFLYLYYYMIGCAKRGYDDIIKYVFLVPVYWLTMSAAAWKAVYEMIVKPHYWQKTVHGLHLKNKKNLLEELKPNVAVEPGD